MEKNTICGWKLARKTFHWRGRNGHHGRMMHSFDNFSFLDSHQVLLFHFFHVLFLNNLVFTSKHIIRGAQRSPWPCDALFSVCCLPHSYCHHLQHFLVRLQLCVTSDGLNWIGCVMRTEERGDGAHHDSFDNNNNGTISHNWIATSK